MWDIKKMIHSDCFALCINSKMILTVFHYFNFSGFSIVWKCFTLAVQMKQWWCRVRLNLTEYVHREIFSVEIMKTHSYMCSDSCLRFLPLTTGHDLWWESVCFSMRSADTKVLFALCVIRMHGLHKPISAFSLSSITGSRWTHWRWM